MTSPIKDRLTQFYNELHAAIVQRAEANQLINAQGDGNGTELASAGLVLHALTLNFLLALGIPEESIRALLDAHTEQHLELHRKRTATPDPAVLDAVRATANMPSDVDGKALSGPRIRGVA